MRMRFAGDRSFRKLIVALALAMSPWIALCANTPADPRQVWQLLDYLAVDYSNAVEAGQIKDAAEYAEMQQFAATAQTLLASLPRRPTQAAMNAQMQQLADAIRQRRDATMIAGQARTLADQLLQVYTVTIAPRAPPDLARGASLYTAQCASCHGATGAADGPLAHALNPPPIDLTDRQRGSDRSPYAYYEIVSHGVTGTAMPSFAGLSSADRWAVGYYASGLAYSESDRVAGARLWRDNATLRAAISDLSMLSRATPSSLASKVGQSRAVELLAYLRSSPVSVASVGRNLSLARTQLQESVTAYRQGRERASRDLALSAYLDGYEPIEARVMARDPALLSHTEAAFGAYRELIERRAPSAKVADQAAAIQALFDRAEILLDASRSRAVTSFLGSFTILIREGIEALLIVVAIVAFLRKAQRPEAMRYVHWGWIGALAAGVVTWLAATQLIQLSGASREMTEGLSSIVASIVLISVGLWMHHKSVAGRWQHYLQSRLTTAMTARSGWFLGALAFIAVYREVFETILFYAALWSEGQHPAIVAGLLGASLALLAVAALMLRATRRLPIAQFFSWSSFLIAVLAIVLIGKGARALQEAGVLGIRALEFPTVSWLAIYPTAQSLLAQLLVLACITFGFVYNYRGTNSSKHVIRSS